MKKSEKNIYENMVRKRMPSQFPLPNDETHLSFFEKNIKSYLSTRISTSNRTSSLALRLLSMASSSKRVGTATALANAQVGLGIVSMLFCAFLLWFLHVHVALAAVCFACGLVGSAWILSWLRNVLLHGLP